MAWKEIVCVVALVAIPGMGAGANPATQRDKAMTIGAYYFGGWAGTHHLAENEKEPWARNAPTHLTRRMVEEFPERQPVWGWRGDSVEIMERQIDLAADHGLAFFAFCWYWHDNGKAIRRTARDTTWYRGTPPDRHSTSTPNWWTPTGGRGAASATIPWLQAAPNHLPRLFHWNATLPRPPFPPSGDFSVYHSSPHRCQSSQPCPAAHPSCPSRIFGPC